ncbi:MAG: glucose 1-dehydrogenase [Pseudomonadota bacterium]
MLQDKVSLVTGAASGIGRAVALAYAREGAKVVVCDIDAKGGEDTTRMLREAGADTLFLRADVSNAEDCRMLVVQAVQAYGQLDIACNNAGIGGALAPTADYPDEAWAQVIGVNLSGVFYGMKHQLGQMSRQGRGAIVNVASILGAVGFANAPAYVAAKHGVVGLTKVAALEYSAAGVRVNAVGPAFVHTPMIAPVQADEASRQALTGMHPIGRLGEPEEVAELVLWLSSDKASFVTGSYYPVDGGFLAR